MIKEIYVNGSSFTHGYGLDLPSFLKELNKYESEYPQWDAPEEERVNFRISNNWPTLLSKLRNLPVTNEADFGGSWERVIRMVSNFILKHENPQEVLYILEMPNSVRKDVWSTAESRYKKVTGTGNWGEPYTNHELHAIESWYASFEEGWINFEKEIKRTIFLSSWLKELGCKFLIIPTEQLHELTPHDATPPFEEPESMILLSKEIKKIDLNLLKFEVNEKHHGCSLLYHDKSNYTNNYEYWTTNMIVFYNDFIKGRIGNEQNGIDDGHPNLLGHQKIAEEVNRYINYYLNNIV